MILVHTMRVKEEGIHTKDVTGKMAEKRVATDWRRLKYRLRINIAFAHVRLWSRI